MIKKYVANSAKKVLPEWLAEYLFGLAGQVPDAELQTFRLTPDTLNGKPAQMIEHTAYRYDYLGKYLMESPVLLDATVSIYRDETSCNMSLSSINIPTGSCEVVKEPLWEQPYDQLIPQES